MTRSEMRTPIANELYVRGLSDDFELLRLDACGACPTKLRRRIRVQCQLGAPNADIVLLLLGRFVRFARRLLRSQVVRKGVAALVGGQPDMRVVGEASNGREAIQRFRAEHPDITLMDIQMPIMNGLDALIAIRDEAP